MVEVFLETAAGCRLTDAEIGVRLRVELAGVRRFEDLMDINLHLRNCHGDWIPVHRDSAGGLTTYPWQYKVNPKWPK